MGAFTSKKAKNYSPSCWFPLSHLDALKMIDEVNLVAVCDQNNELLKQVEQIYGPTNTFNDFNDMLEKMTIDLACVATRTPIRTEIITSCIRNGVRALHVEKPLCNSLDELEKLEAMIKESGTILTYGAIRRHFEVYKRAKKMIDSGDYGELQQIEVAFGHSQLFWTHPHSVDLILFFAGHREFKSAQAKVTELEFYYKDGSLVIESDPYVDNATLNFSNGVTAIMTKNQGWDLVLSCSKGKIVVSENGKKITSQVLKKDNPFLDQIVSFEDKADHPQGTYSALIETVTDLNSSAGRKQSVAECQSDYIFLGHRILFLLVQSHMNNSALKTMADLKEGMTILGKSGDLYA
jgi:predicted dehydrogenase